MTVVLGGSDDNDDDALVTAYIIDGTAAALSAAADHCYYSYIGCRRKRGGRRGRPEQGSPVPYIVEIKINKKISPSQERRSALVLSVVCCRFLMLCKRIAAQMYLTPYYGPRLRLHPCLCCLAAASGIVLVGGRGLTSPGSGSPGQLKRASSKAAFLSSPCPAPLICSCTAPSLHGSTYVSPVRQPSATLCGRPRTCATQPYTNCNVLNEE